MNNCAKIISTGSKGNCIVVTDSQGNKLVVDCGVSWKDFIESEEYSIDKISAVIYSHAHKDHCLSAKNFISHGIPVFANKYCPVKTNDISEYKSYGSMPFKIGTFEVEHSTPNNAFVIDTIDNVRILYITDAMSIKTLVKNVDYLFIECNSDDEHMVDNMVEGVFTNSHPEFHLSLQNCIKYLKKIDRSSLKEVILWHMSESNADKIKCKKAVSIEMFPVKVSVAESDMLIDFQEL